MSVTAYTLWIRTQNYVREQMAPGTAEKTISDVAAKVYAEMRFLVEPSQSTSEGLPK